MRVIVLYVYPMVQVRKYYAAALTFARTYQEFPAGFDHELHVIYNGRQPLKNEEAVFAGIASQGHTHDNVGWDIGAYQRFADSNECDLLVCLGAHAHFHRAGWLTQMVSAYLDFGPGLYGCAAYVGHLTHVRTTMFWCPPELLRSYPAYVGTSRASRYEFEHGKTSFTNHVLKLGFPCVMATWEANYLYPDWHEHAPDAQKILVRDQHIHL